MIIIIIIIIIIKDTHKRSKTFGDPWTRISERHPNQ